MTPHEGAPTRMAAAPVPTGRGRRRWRLAGRGAAPFVAAFALSWAIVVRPAEVRAAPAAAEASRADPATFDYRLRPRALAPGVWVVEGAVEDFAPSNGCNIINTGFIATGAGVVVVNTGPSRRYGEQLRAAIASVTDEPVVRVLALNRHPDYFLGNQAFEAGRLASTPRTADGIRAEAKSLESNLYRLCGDWMRDTVTVAPLPSVESGDWRIGSRRLRLIELDGHTDSDLAVLDVDSGVLFAGGLVFVDRAATTPHADLPRWRAALAKLRELPHRVVVPSHGPVDVAGRGIAQTDAWLAWMDATMRDAAVRGLEMSELLALPIPAEFASLAVLRAEWVRNVAHLYPRYERQALGVLR